MQKTVNSLQRREFLKFIAASGMIASLGGLLLATGADGGELGPAPEITLGDPLHELQLTREEILGGVTLTLSLQGKADHEHRGTIDSDQFSRLRREGSIVIDTTSDQGHYHSIRVRFT